jgi:multidrug efflux pump
VLLTNVAVKNRTTVLVLMLLIIVAGMESYLTLPRESSPDVDIPYILVTTTYEGASPEDIENTVTKEIEKELSGLDDLEEITSISAEGMSMITIEFTPDVRIEDALQRVRDRVEIAKADLPLDAEEPIVRDINISEFPIVIVNISGDISPVRLKLIADQLEDAIEGVPGVLNVDVLGALEREIRIEVDQDRLAAYGLTIPEILGLVPSENVNVSAGGLETEGTRFNIRLPAEFTEPEEVETLQVADRNGQPIYLTDIATVRDTFKDRTSYARINGKDSISLNIQKRIGADIIPIAETVRHILSVAREQAPDGVEFAITMDESKDIRNMLADLENNIISGLVLVVVVLMLFMGLRSSLVVALAIPMSMLISFSIIQLLGYTLNMIVLFSLILSLGMLVDNAIVIVENIHRHIEMGYSRIEAAQLGTAEVAWPVIASTATTIAAFAPMLFWPGIVGDFMKYLPITVIIVLSSSLFVALVINPTIAAMAATAGTKSASDHPHTSRTIRAYRWLLNQALHHRVVTISLTVLLLLALVIVYGKRGEGVDFFPDLDPIRARINIRCPQGTHIDETNRLAALVEERVEQFRSDIEHVITNVGSESGSAVGFGGEATGPHVANITIKFLDFLERNRPSMEVMQDIRVALADIAGAEIKVGQEEMGPPTGAAVTVRLVGQEFRVLEELSTRAKNLILDVPGLVNLRSDLEATRPEIVFDPDRQRAVQLGVNTAVIGNFLKTAIFGMKVGSYRQFNDEYDITVRLPELQRSSLEDLMRLHVPNNFGAAVPLSSLGEFSYKGGFGNITRIDEKRVVTITGDSEGRLPEMVLADVEQRLAGLELPAGYELRYAGEKEEQDKAVAFLSRAFLYALLAIVLILVAQFNTLTVPVIIMFTVTMSTIGVFIGLLVNHMPFIVIMTGIGVISLAGVVVNNGIVLLDYTRQLEARGLGLVEAAHEAGVTRLRPVLLTAVTTILGLVPMATGISFDFRHMEWALKSESSQWWENLAISVIFGLAFATLLTLVFVPTLYVSMGRFRRRRAETDPAVDGRE